MLWLDIVISIFFFSAAIWAVYSLSLFFFWLFSSSSFEAYFAVQNGYERGMLWGRAESGRLGLD